MNRFFLCASAALLPTACRGPVAEPGPYTAIDGDTIRSSASTTIRLARIDAPELPGHCRRGRRCIQGNPYEAQRRLQLMLDNMGAIECETIDHDRYGRRIAECYGWFGNQRYNLSTEMYRTGTVGIYTPPLSVQAQEPQR